MSTLVLSPFFYPELISTGRYNTVLVESLALHGEAVTVFASHPLYPRWRPERSDAQLPGVAIERGGLWLRYPRAAVLRRLVLETWFALFVCRKYLRLRSKPDYVVPIFPPSLFHYCLRPLLAHDVKVVGIVHDLQGVLAGSTPGAGRLLKGLIGWLEGRCFASCHRLIFLSRSMAERAIEQYGLDRDRCVVRYPFLTLRPNGLPSGNALATLLPTDRVNVVYSGALGDKQSPDELLAFLSSLADRQPRILCHVFSAGPHFERLKQTGASVPEQKISFHPLVAEEQLDELYARSTIQIIPQLDGTADASLPSKLPNLIAAGVPVFAICDPRSEVNNLLAAANAGLSAASFNAADIGDRFDALLAAIDSESRESRIQRQRLFVEENFSVAKVVQAILND